MEAAGNSSSLPLVDEPDGSVDEERPAITSYAGASLRVRLMGRPVTRRVLLFGGITRPHRGWDSPAWWLPWCLFRVSLAGTGSWALGYYVPHTPLSEPGELVVFWTVALQAITAFSCFWWLPKRLDEPTLVIADDERNNLVGRAERVTLWFLVVFGVTSIISAITVSAYYDFGFQITTVSFFLILPVLMSTTAVLAALLLVVATEMDAATSAIHHLQTAAWNTTLNRAQYIETRDAIAKRDSKWSVPLGVLAVVAFLNTVAFVGALYLYDRTATEPCIRPIRFCVHNKTEFEVLFALLIAGPQFIKEAALLMILLSLTAILNDQSDALAAILISEGPWGAPGSESEASRLDIISLATQFVVRPEALKSNYSFLTTPFVQPITFGLAGVRVTRTMFLAYTASLMLSLVIRKQKACGKCGALQSYPPPRAP